MDYTYGRLDTDPKHAGLGGTAAFLGDPPPPTEAIAMGAKGIVLLHCEIASESVGPRGYAPGEPTEWIKR